MAWNAMGTVLAVLGNAGGADVALALDVDGGKVLGLNAGTGLADSCI